MSQRVVHEGIGAEIERVLLRKVVFRHYSHCSFLTEGHRRKAVLVEEVTGYGRGVMQTVLELDASLHQDIVRDSVEIERVAPSLLFVGSAVDVSREEEDLVVTFIPAGRGGEHIVVFPEIYVSAENCLLRIGMIIKRLSLDEDRVREHVHVFFESEEFRLRAICSVQTLDNLAVLVLHRSAFRKHGHAVRRVVIEKVRS